jgi:hypothetical protein
VIPFRAAAALLAVAAAAAAVGAASAAPEGPAGGGAGEMDVDLLRKSRLKLFVAAKVSANNTRKLAAIRDLQKVDDDRARARPGGATTEEEDRIREVRRREIQGRLLQEKTEAVQLIHVIDRILNDGGGGGGGGKAERAILERRIDLVEIPRGANGKGMDIRDAAKLLSEALGCPVKVESIETEIFRIWFTMGPTTGEAVIKQVAASVPFEWSIRDGVVLFRHRNALKAPPADPGLDEEERKAKEEEERRKGK